MPVAEPHSRVSSGAQAAAALTFPMSTNSSVFLNVNAFLCPLLGAGVVRTHCGGWAERLEFSSYARAFLFFFLSLSPAELALKF